jgi:formylglycine-generating enzyme required for sulfatase activity
VKKRISTLTCLLICGLAAAAESVNTGWQEPLSGISFVPVPKGCFTMGRNEPIPPPPDSYWDNIRYVRPVNIDEKPEHQVCVDAFWMAQYEVTEAQWAKVMGRAADGTQPAASSKSGKKAKGGIGYSEAQAFVTRLSELSGGIYRFRVPTEAEWEYACRAGGQDIALEPDSLAKQAWFAVEEIEKAKPRAVGQLAPNALGLFDMLGNVWEWTTDSYQADSYQHHTLYNPRIEVTGAPQTIRGGSVRTEHLLVRCSKRGHVSLTEQALPLIGLRLVRVP